MRVFAFAIDLLFLSILTIAILPTTYEGRGRPSEVAITCVVWLWFIYFVFFDWRFHGTPGKRMLGLSVVGTGAKYSFLRMSLRALLTLCLPVAVGLLGGFAAGDSRFGLAIALLIRSIFQLANPVSILVLGGNRGFVDRITKTEVRIGSSRSCHRDVLKRGWVFAFAIPVIGGLAITVLDCMCYGALTPKLNSSLGILPKPTGANVTAVVSWENPGGEFKAACIAPGFRQLSTEVLSIQIDTLSKNPFTVENTDLIVNPIDATNLKLTDGIPIIRITTTSWVSPASYSTIAKNIALCDASVMDDGKHSTVVIQFDQFDDYGFFSIMRNQYTVLGIDRKGSNVSWAMADLRPGMGVSVSVSTDLGGFALLGRGNVRERILGGN